MIERSLLYKIMWRELEWMDEGCRPDEYLINQLCHLVLPYASPNMTARFLRTMRAVIEAFYANYY